MEKHIPIYFDSVIIDSPLQSISTEQPNIGRVKVRVFTKYGNRNGSYITDAVADQLINSACAGNVPVIGFFDPETQTWASHSGPTLANAYGYVETFLGWEPFTDTDGQTRDYAVFSVILFTDYFAEAQKILGQNQSMELDPLSITGDWTVINNQEYFVYKTAKMLGFCIIGEHEPCFSVSSFFSKNDDLYISQYEKFSSLLGELKTKVEELENFQGGGKTDMPEEKDTVVDTFQATEDSVVEETVVAEEQEQVEEVVDTTEVETTDEVTDSSENEDNTLQNQYDALNSQFSLAQNTIADLNTTIQDLNNKLTDLQANYDSAMNKLNSYELVINQMNDEKKNALIEQYTKVLTADDMKDIVAQKENYSYDELESKFALQFAKKNLNNTNEKIPLCNNPEQSQFARLMEKYRK